MTPSEWLEIAAVIRARWPHSRLPEETIVQWGADLEDLPAAHVVAALDVAYREGRDHPPHGGHLRRTVAELAVAAPEWADAQRAIAQILGHSSRLRRVVHELDAFTADEGDGLYMRDDFAAAMAEAHPVVASFINRVGAGSLRNATSGSDEARMRDKWNAHCRGLEKRVALRGIPSGGLRALAEIEAGDGAEVPDARQLGSALSKIRGELEAA